MAITPPRQVISGFYRVHLWVLLGLGTFGSLIAFSQRAVFAHATLLIGLAVATTVLSYVGSVIWLYERTTVGMKILVIISLLSFSAVLVAYPAANLNSQFDWIWLIADAGTGGLLLGSTFAAMLLGHWYLNSPSMKLDPLRRLIIVLAATLLARAALCAVGFVFHYQEGALNNSFMIAAVAMRWLAGVVGLAGMTWMTWQTLKIPNTQSATGILYVALLFVFLGELASALLSYQHAIPL